MRVGAEDRLHVVDVVLLALFQRGERVLVGADLGDLRLPLFLFRLERRIARYPLVLVLLEEDGIALVVLQDGLGLEERSRGRALWTAVRLRLLAPALELRCRPAF